MHLCAKVPFFSRIYGAWQKTPFTKKKIRPFIKSFGVDTGDFLEDVTAFKSFNDFFCRKLKPAARPIAPGDDAAIIPADGRYYFYQDISRCAGFIVKDKKFDLPSLLCSQALATKYAAGSMVLARLCPTDYHRFHFPCDCLPGETALINGWLYSVNPLAVKQNIHIFTENRRTLCQLHTQHFGDILFMEVGASNVGSIHQTYAPHQVHAKGDEKGFFSFGGSSLILLFEHGRITFDADLLQATLEGLEIKCLIGQHMGKLNK